MTVGSRPIAVQRVTMPLAGIAQEITVGTAATDVRAEAASNLDSFTVDEQALNNLPIFNDDVVGTMSRFLDSSAIGTNGVMLIVNGVEVNSLTLPASAIQQIKINQDPLRARVPPARPRPDRNHHEARPAALLGHGQHRVS